LCFTSLIQLALNVLLLLCSAAKTKLRVEVLPRERPVSPPALEAGAEGRAEMAEEQKEGGL